MNANADNEALKRLLDEDDWGIWKKCPVDGCDRCFPNFSAVISHLRRDHGMFRNES